MKKRFITGVFIVLVTGFVSAQTNTDVLPQAAKDFISTHFSAETISRVEEENEWFTFDSNEMYEVHFSNGIRVDFNKKGEPTEVTTRNRAELPEAIFPERIRTYIEENYANTEIIAWEVERTKQEIELSDGREIEFDLDNNFRKED